MDDDNLDPCICICVWTPSGVKHEHHCPEYVSEMTDQEIHAELLELGYSGEDLKAFELRTQALVKMLHASVQLRMELKATQNKLQKAETEKGEAIERARGERKALLTLLEAFEGMEKAVERARERIAPLGSKEP